MGASTTLQFIPAIVPVVDTSAYAGGDVIFNSVEIPDAVFAKGRSGLLRMVSIFDKSAQAATMDLIFTKNQATFGTLNGAVSISDANAVLAEILGHVQVAATDYTALVGSSLATKIISGGLVLEAASTSRSIWVAGVGRTTTPTYGAASDLVLNFGIEWH
jgi:hypothetical protein